MRGENHNSRLASQKQFVISTLLFSPAGIGKLAAGTGRDRATNVNSCDATNTGAYTDAFTGAFTGAYTGGAAVSIVAASGPTGPIASTGVGNTIDEQKAVAGSERVGEQA